MPHGWPIHVTRTPVPASVPDLPSSKDHGGAKRGAASFGDAPVTTSCPHCHKAITTTISYRHSCLGVTICLVTALLLGWYAFCLVPFLWLGLKDAVHTCPSCRNLIHRHSRIHIPITSVRDEVVTVKCGSCAVVLSRRYFLLFFVILFLILLFYVLRAGWLGTALDVIPKGKKRRTRLFSFLLSPLDFSS
ncbi:putative LITAF-like protein, partial [Toxoplasma gondii MAS]